MSESMFQVSETDLATLERLLPSICDEFLPHLNNRTRMKFRECQKILSQVRWNYGPVQLVEKVVE